MSASLTDKITETFNGGNPAVTTVASPRAISGTTLTGQSLLNWPTNTKVHFQTYKLSSANVKSSQTDWSGIVSGSSINNLTYMGGAADSGNGIGDYIEMMPTYSWAQDLAQALEVLHNNDGSWKAGAALNTPTIASFINAIHNHSNAAGGGQIGFTGLGTGALRLGLGTDAGATLTNAFVTHAQVTATTHGGVVELIWGALMGNGNSGADRNTTAQILCDGVATGITPATVLLNNPNNGLITGNLSYGFTHNQTGLAAGAHTWALQFEASANAAVILANNFLRVAEVV